MTFTVQNPFDKVGGTLSTYTKVTDKKKQDNMSNLVFIYEVLKLIL